MKRMILVFVMLVTVMFGADFDKSIAFTFKYEGSGLDKSSNHSRYGVSKETIQRYNKIYKTKYTVNSLTKTQAKTIAKKLYWQAYNIESITNDKLATAVFDFVYNSNPTNAMKTIEKKLVSLGVKGVKIDGTLSKKEIEKMNSLSGNKLANNICDARLSYMKTLKVWSKYKNGWSTRVNAIKKL